MDHQIGRLIKFLSQEDLLDDSIIIFASDHGELLFDHGLFRKVQPYQGSVNIPFIVRVGDRVASESSLINPHQLVGLRDIAPTILDFVGITLPKQMDGISLRSTIFNESKTREFIHGEHSGASLSNHFIVTETDKFI